MLHAWGYIAPAASTLALEGGGACEIHACTVPLLVCSFTQTMRVLQLPMRALCVPVRSFSKRLCARPLIKPCVYFRIPCMHFMPAVRAHGFLWKVNAFGNWCAHFHSHARARNFFCACTFTF